MKYHLFKIEFQNAIDKLRFNKEITSFINFLFDLIESKLYHNIRISLCNNA